MNKLAFHQRAPVLPGEAVRRGWMMRGNLTGVSTVAVKPRELRVDDVLNYQAVGKGPVRHASCLTDCAVVH